MTIQRPAILVAALLLAGCGSGDNPTEPAPDPDTSTVPASVSLSGAPASLVVGDTFQLAATVRNDEGGTLAAASVSWSTPDGEQLEPLGSGRFRSMAGGQARVVAAAGSVADTLAVEAEARVATSVTTELASTLFITGDEETPRVEVRDQRGRPMAEPELIWESSDPDVLEVTSEGVVQARSAGTADLVLQVEGADGPQTTLGLRVFPGSGPRVPELVEVDSAVVAWMEAFSVPGAQVAIMHEGRLVHSRGYGVQSADRPDPVQEDNLFRIGSVSKPVTGLAYLQLVDQGLASLDDRPFDVLQNHYSPLPGESMDSRLPTATARQILRHQTGYGDREVDVLSWRAVWQHGDTTIDEIFRRALGHPLDQDPGTVFNYTNFNTLSIARYIEVLTGTDYESHVRDALMAPAGVTRMTFGRSALQDRDPMEVRYHDETGSLTSMMDADDHVMVHWDASGAWIGTATDLMRLVRAALEGTPGVEPLLSDEIQDEVRTRNPEVSGSANAFYGLHWSVDLSGSDPVWSHNGAARGAWARLYYDHGGTGFALLSNRHSNGELAFQLGPLLSAVEWPEHDLFDR